MKTKTSSRNRRRARPVCTSTRRFPRRRLAPVSRSRSRTTRAPSRRRSTRPTINPTRRTRRTGRAERIATSSPRPTTLGICTLVHASLSATENRSGNGLASTSTRKAPIVSSAPTRGLRAAIPLVDLRVGARYVWDFQQYYLVPANSYHRIDFQSQELSRASYTTLEAEITGNVPLGPGSLLGVASGSYMTGVPKDVFVYDETLRIIIKPPYEWRLRGGYAVRLGAEGKISVGIVADVLGMPGRRSGEVLRAGIIGQRDAQQSRGNSRLVRPADHQPRHDRRRRRRLRAARCSLPLGHRFAPRKQDSALKIVAVFPRPPSESS